MLQDIIERFKRSKAYKNALLHRAEFADPAITIDVPTDIVAISERIELYALCKATGLSEEIVGTLEKPCAKGFVHVLAFLPAATLGRVALVELS
jgi:hypothetical protein